MPVLTSLYIFPYNETLVLYRMTQYVDDMLKVDADIKLVSVRLENTV